MNRSYGSRPFRSLFWYSSGFNSGAYGRTPGLLSVRARPGLRDLGVRVPAHDRITIDFARVDEGDLAGLRSGQDVGFRGELVRRDPRIELDEDLIPQGIEVLTRDGAEHGRESLRLVQVVRNEDGLEPRVVREDRGGGT